MKRKLKIIIPIRDIIVVETPINDDVIANLRANDDCVDEHLKFVIKAYVAHIEDNENIEILGVGNSYFITEDCVYIAIYEDEFNDETLEV